MGRNDIKIEDCPFCGRQGGIAYTVGPRKYVIANNKNNMQYQYKAGCFSCRIYTPSCDSKEEAIDIWNKRYDLPKESSRKDAKCST